MKRAPPKNEAVNSSTINSGSQQKKAQKKLALQMFRWRKWLGNKHWCEINFFRGNLLRVHSKLEPVNVCYLFHPFGFVFVFMIFIIYITWHAIFPWLQIPHCIEASIIKQSLSKSMSFLCRYKSPYNTKWILSIQCVCTQSGYSRGSVDWLCTRCDVKSIAYGTNPCTFTRLVQQLQSVAESASWTIRKWSTASMPSLSL